MTDPTRRGASITAAAVAIPIALAAGLFSLWKYGAFDGPAAPSPKVQATGAVTMSAPALSEATAEVCRGVVAQLPDTLRDAPRRPVSAGAEQNAAYGDPAVTLACGAGQPAV